MEPGRELDLLVAEKVMGYKIAEVKGDAVVSSKISAGSNDNPWLNKELKPYSTDIAAAWEVVEKMKKEFIQTEIIIWQTGHKARISKFAGTSLNVIALINHVEAEGESAAHAICLAALKAKGIEI